VSDCPRSASVGIHDRCRVNFPLLPSESKTGPDKGAADTELTNWNIHGDSEEIPATG
jgi:hypothetical protein